MKRIKLLLIFAGIIICISAMPVSASAVENNNQSISVAAAAAPYEDYNPLAYILLVGLSVGCAVGIIAAKRHKQ